MFVNFNSNLNCMDGSSTLTMGYIPWHWEGRLDIIVAILYILWKNLSTRKISEVGE